MYRLRDSKLNERIGHEAPRSRLDWLISVAILCADSVAPGLRQTVSVIGLWGDAALSEVALMYGRTPSSPDSRVGLSDGRRGTSRM